MIHGSVRQDQLRSRKQPWELHLRASSLSGEQIVSVFPCDSSQAVCSVDEYQTQVYR
jgi:hypothetical protein